MPLADAMLHQRVIYAESAGRGQSVMETPNSEAAKEIAALASNIVLEQERKVA
jgi:chromosome partitioning protein